MSRQGGWAIWGAGTLQKPRSPGGCPRVSLCGESRNRCPHGELAALGLQSVWTPGFTMEEGELWRIESPTQTPYGLPEAATKFPGIPNQRVYLKYVEALGCYGQNAADDVVIDVLGLFQAVGKPARVQWSRA